MSFNQIESKLVSLKLSSCWRWSGVKMSAYFFSIKNVHIQSDIGRNWGFDGMSQISFCALTIAELYSRGLWGFWSNSGKDAHLRTKYSCSRWFLGLRKQEKQEDFIVSRRRFYIKRISHLCQMQKCSFLVPSLYMVLEIRAYMFLFIFFARRTMLPNLNKAAQMTIGSVFLFLKSREQSGDLWMMQYWYCPKVIVPKSSNNS